jgi:hypothetical protein
MSNKNQTDHMADKIDGLFQKCQAELKLIEQRRQQDFQTIMEMIDAKKTADIKAKLLKS